MPNIYKYIYININKYSKYIYINIITQNNPFLY